MTCIKMAMQKAEVERAQLEAVGITNQRESTLAWNKYVWDHIYTHMDTHRAVSLIVLCYQCRLFDLSWVCYCTHAQDDGPAVPQRDRLERHPHPRHLRGAEALVGAYERPSAQSK